MLRSSRRILAASNPAPRVFDSVSTLPNVSIEEVRKSPHSQYRKSKDVVSQVVSLGRSGVSPNDPVWSQVADTVTHSLSRMDGADFATIVKKFSTAGFRDELMLVGISESLKYLCQMGRVRPQNIADILSGFHRLNFVPSVEVLNVLAEQTQKAVALYRTRPIDLCKLFRYFSILESNPTLCVDYDSKFSQRSILNNLETEIEKRIGYFGPVEIAIVARYATRMSMRSLMENFARTENCPDKVHAYFIRQLDRRFGQHTWKQFYYLLRPAPVDSTGWGMKPRFSDTDSDEEEDDVAIRSQHRRPDLPMFQVDENRVRDILQSITVERDKRESTVVKSSPRHKAPEHEICQAQIEALALLEEEVGMERKQRLVEYNDHVPKRDRRVDERRDYLKKGSSRNLKRLKNFKKSKRNSLFKFAILATARRKLDSP